MSCPVAAVIVAHDSNAELPACLAAVRARVAEAVVIDNCPESPVAGALKREHAWARWIDNGENRGFAAAVNQGVAATSAPYVLLLNPDCVLRTGLEGMVEACRVPEVAGAGGLLLDPAGRPQSGFASRSLPTPWTLAFEALGLNRAWPGNPVNRRYRLRSLDPGRESEVPQPAGAFLLLKRAALAAVRGMDEAYWPAWFEDVDLCRRLYDAGFSLRHTPSAVALHSGGHSVNRLPLPARLDAWYGGLLRFAAKHFSRGAYRRVRAAVLVGLLLRKLSCRLRGGSVADAAAYGSAFRRLRGGCPERTRKARFCR